MKKLSAPGGNRTPSCKPMACITRPPNLVVKIVTFYFASKWNRYFETWLPVRHSLANPSSWEGITLFSRTQQNIFDRLSTGFSLSVKSILATLVLLFLKDSQFKVRSEIAFKKILVISILIIIGNVKSNCTLVIQKKTVRDWKTLLIWLQLYCINTGFIMKTHNI